MGCERLLSLFDPLLCLPSFRPLGLASSRRQERRSLGLGCRPVHSRTRHRARQGRSHYQFVDQICIPRHPRINGCLVHIPTHLRHSSSEAQLLTRVPRRYTKIIPDPNFWAMLVVLPVLCFDKRFAWKYAKRMYRPQSYHHVQEIQKYNIQDYRPRYVDPLNLRCELR